MSTEQAAADLEAFVGRPLDTTYLYRRKVRMPSGVQAVTLLGAEIDGVFHVGLVGEAADPWLVAAPDWETVRRGRREREIALLRLYIGRAVYALRKPLEPTDKMRALAERRLATVRKAPQVADAQIHDIVHVPGHGGTHITFLVTRESGRIEYRNHRGRAHSPAKTVLRAISEHAAWFFLGLEFNSP